MVPQYEIQLHAAFDQTIDAVEFEHQEVAWEKNNYVTLLIEEKKTLINYQVSIQI